MESGGKRPEMYKKKSIENDIEWEYTESDKWGWREMRGNHSWVGIMLDRLAAAVADRLISVEDETGMAQCTLRE
jgi:hypothetical protein